MTAEQWSKDSVVLSTASILACLTPSTVMTVDARLFPKPTGFTDFRRMAFLV